MINNKKKRKVFKNIGLVTSLLLVVGGWSAVSTTQTNLTLQNSSNQTFNKTKSLYANNESLKSSDNLISNSLTTQSYFTYENNVIKNYSYSNIEKFTITLKTNQKVVSLLNYDVFDNSFLTVLTSSNELLIYNLANPFKVEKTIALNDDFNKMAYNQNTLFVFNDQTSTSSLNKLLKVNLLSFKTQEINYPSILANSAIFKIVNIFENTNLIFFLDSSENKISNTQTFSKIKYLFADNNLQPITKLNNSSSVFYEHAFTRSLLFSEINSDFKHFDLSQAGKQYQYAAIISLSDAILFLKNNLKMQVVSTPNNNLIHSAVFKDKEAYILLSDKKIQRLVYDTKNFILTQNAASIYKETGSTYNFPSTPLNLPIPTLSLPSNERWFDDAAAGADVYLSFEGWNAEKFKQLFSYLQTIRISNTKLFNSWLNRIADQVDIALKIKAREVTSNVSWGSRLFSFKFDPNAQANQFLYIGGYNPNSEGVYNGISASMVLNWQWKIPSKQAFKNGIIRNMGRFSSQLYTDENNPAKSFENLTKKYDLIDVNYDKTFLITNGSKYYGISNQSFELIRSQVDYEVFANGAFYKINNNSTPIPIIASQLKTSVLFPRNTISRKENYLINGDIKFLDLNLESSKNNSSASINFELISTAWYNKEKSMQTSVFLKIDNFISLQIAIDKLWINNNLMQTRLNRSINLIDKIFIEKNLEPLDLRSIQSSVLNFENTEFYVSDVGSETPSFNLNALITFSNKVNNETKTISSKQNYFSNSTITSEKSFKVFGQENANSKNEIPISTAILTSRRLLPSSLSSFLPSYIYRSMFPNIYPDVDQVKDFYDRFTNTKLIDFTPIVEPDDENGNLKITYILSDSVNDKYQYTYTYTGFKKYSDFEVSLKGTKIEQDFDFQTVDLPENIKDKTLFELSTGYSLQDLFENKVKFDNVIKPNKAEEINKFYESLDNSNLSEMKFFPTISNLSLDSKEKFLENFKNGIMELQLKYSGLTQDFAKKLGLNEHYAKALSYKNLKTPVDFYNFSVNEEQKKNLINEFNVNTSLTNTKFQEKIKQTLISKGFDLNLTTFEYVWKDDVLEIKVIPQQNQLTHELQLLPKDYTFQYSWANKNQQEALKLGLMTGIPVGSILLILLILFILYYKKKISLRRYY